MRSFEADYLHEQPVSHAAVRLLAQIGERRGKQELYRQAMPRELARLVEHAIIQSAECSNRLEGVEARPERLREVMQGRADPGERSECEIAGYRAALDRIHRDHAAMTPSPELAMALHRQLYALTGTPGGAWKRTDNEITEIGPSGARVVRFRTVSAADTPRHMAGLHEMLDRELRAEMVHPLLITAAYVLDFLCIHPFSDGNGRVARLLTLLLLYRCGYEVGRYVSLERIIEENRESYYEALRQSSMGWHDARHSLRPWTEFLLGVIASAYDELEAQIGGFASARGAKSKMVEDAVAGLPATFRTRDIERLCPSVSRDLIRVVLNRLRSSGAIRSEGSGAGAVWRKIGPAA